MYQSWKQSVACLFYRLWSLPTDQLRCQTVQSNGRISHLHALPEASYMYVVEAFDPKKDLEREKKMWFNGVDQKHDAGVQIQMKGKTIRGCAFRWKSTLYSFLYLSSVSDFSPFSPPLQSKHVNQISIVHNIYTVSAPNTNSCYAYASSRP